MTPTDHPGAPLPARPGPILVAEDNPINQEVIVEQLSLLGYQADVADDGQHAFERWQQGRHALLLTDLQMPRMDGYELTRAIREHEAGERREGLPRTRIVALTASAEASEQARCLQAGMDHHLPKPLDLGELKARLQDWLQGGAAAARPSAAPAVPEPMAEPLSAAAVMDPDALAQYVGDDPATLAWFRNDFRQRLGEARGALTAAWAQGHNPDWRALADQSHQLKSTSRTVGAMRLAACCQALEQAAKRMAPDDAAQAWAEVGLAIVETDQALASLTGSPAPG